MNRSTANPTRSIKRKRRLIAAVLGCSIISTSSLVFAEIYTNPYASDSVSRSVHFSSQDNDLVISVPVKTKNETGAVEINRNTVAPKTKRDIPRPKRLPPVTKNTPSRSQPNTKPISIAKRRRAPQSMRGDSAIPSRAASQFAKTPLQRATARVSAQPASAIRPVAAASNTTTKTASWLPSTTSTSCQQQSLRLLGQAMTEYQHRAWASAEDSGWESLRYAAEGIDITERNASFGTNRGSKAASNDLQIARTAIREARDFAGKYGDLDVAAMERVVLSHNTTVLKNLSLRGTPPTDAIDRYLNEARIRLARLATYRPEAAQAIDLIAAIQLGRGDEDLLPSQTALCLRRAALQGQPENANLAERLGMHLAAQGLDSEAKWALEHAMTLNPSPAIHDTLMAVTQRAGDRANALRMAAQMRSRLPSGYNHERGPVPQVVQLSPRQFASVSKSVVPPQSAAPTKPKARIAATPAGYRRSSGQSQPDQSQGLLPPTPHAIPVDPPIDAQDLYAKPKRKSAVSKVMDAVKFW